MSVDTHHLRTLLAAATPGPWDAHKTEIEAPDCLVTTCEYAWDERDREREVQLQLEAGVPPEHVATANAALIAAAVNALPELLDALDALDARERTVNALLRDRDDLRREAGVLSDAYTSQEAELAKLQDAYSVLSAQVMEDRSLAATMQLREENARLRAALQGMADGDTCDTLSYADCCDRRCVHIARAALAGEEATDA